jgi:hypothetical protein
MRREVDALEEPPSRDLKSLSEGHNRRKARCSSTALHLGDRRRMQARVAR